VAAQESFVEIGGAILLKHVAKLGVGGGELLVAGYAYHITEVLFKPIFPAVLERVQLQRAGMFERWHAVDGFGTVLDESFPFSTVPYGRTPVGMPDLPRFDGRNR
jgi:hypothetical protein